MNHSSCIYCIENTINKKKYIGQTIDFQRRKLSHLSALRNGKSHNSHLQASFNKYGESAFIFYVIEECDVDMLNREHSATPKRLKYKRLGLKYGKIGAREKVETAKKACT